jgi:transposase
MIEQTTTTTAVEFDRLVTELDRANLRYAEVEHAENEAAFELAADARLDAEDALLGRNAETLHQRNVQIAILARRAVGGICILQELISLSAS